MRNKKGLQLYKWSFFFTVSFSTFTLTNETNSDNPLSASARPTSIGRSHASASIITSHNIEDGLIGSYSSPPERT